MFVSENSTNPIISIVIAIEKVDQVIEDLKSEYAQADTRIRRNYLNRCLMWITRERFSLYERIFLEKQKINIIQITEAESVIRQRLPEDLFKHYQKKQM